VTAAAHVEDGAAHGGVAPVVTATDRDGRQHRVAGLVGKSLMVTLKYEGGLDVAADCGGNCFCATCHVYVADEWLERLPVQSEEELELLDELVHSTPSSRLACQIPVVAELDGLSLTLAPRE
jgi:2Fe-2S ferredoxin